MCGIAGLFSPDLVPLPIDRDRLGAMAEAIVHRGPDEGGFHLEPHVGLAHRRLSIIDLATGQQPLANEDGSVLVTYNGEIYNYADLTRELEQAGHRFRTRSDTEVIVHAWEQWGERCVERFRGMFAFALWDRNRKTLFLARDRLGVKPLHYAFLADGGFAFASELKCFKRLPQFDRTLDDEAIEQYLALGYVPDPATIYVRARKLAPGHWLRFKVGERAPRIQEYWDVRFGPDAAAGGAIDPDEAAEELRARLDDVVRMRLMSEVPLGAFLSGGVDSGTVVAVMAGLSAAPVTTCSIGFVEPAFDESAQARVVAERYRTDHHQAIVSRDQFALAGPITRLYDEPFADSSAIPTWHVCGLARTRVKVALSGDGGDEAFGGYRRYRLHLFEQRMRAVLPGAIRRAVFEPLGRWCPKLDMLPRPFRAKSTLQALARDAVTGYCHSVSVLREDERVRLYTPAFRARLAGYRTSELFESHARRMSCDDPLALIQYLDYRTYLPGDINTKVDRASMAHSLEVREPLMDHELVQWVATLPSRLKIRDGASKWLLKRAAEPLLPRQLLHRSKMGFAVPIADWFRGESGARLARGLADGPAVAAGILDRHRIVRMLDEHRSGRRAWGSPLWSIFCLNEFLAAESAPATGTQTGTLGAATMAGAASAEPARA